MLDLRIYFQNKQRSNNPISDFVGIPFTYVCTEPVCALWKKFCFQDGFTNERAVSTDVRTYIQISTNCKFECVHLKRFTSHFPSSAGTVPVRYCTRLLFSPFYSKTMITSTVPYRTVLRTRQYSTLDCIVRCNKVPYRSVLYRFY